MEHEPIVNVLNRKFYQKWEGEAKTGAKIIEWKEN